MPTTTGRATMNKATRAKRLAQATVTTMVRDGITYLHHPSTVGHDKHDASCWTPDGSLLPVDCDTITEYGMRQRLSFQVRVF